MAYSVFRRCSVRCLRSQYRWFAGIEVRMCSFHYKYTSTPDIHRVQNPILTVTGLLQQCQDRIRRISNKYSTFISNFYALLPCLQLRSGLGIEAKKGTMQRREAIKLLGASTMGGVMSLTGCTQLNISDSSGQPGSSNTVRMVTEDHKSYFDPVGLYVEPGETVSFKMVSGNHSATAYHDQYSLADVTRIPKGAQPFDSEVIIDEGVTFEHTFNTEGTYDYYCIPHKTMGMIARIVVGKPGGPAEGSMPPDGKVPTSQQIVKQKTVAYDNQ